MALENHSGDAPVTDATSENSAVLRLPLKGGMRAVTKNKVYPETLGADWENKRRLCAARLRMT